MVQKDKIVEGAQTESDPSPGGTETGVEVQGSVDEHNIVVERTGRRKFVSGVVEGKLKLIM